MNCYTVSMKKIIFIVFAIIVLLALGFFALNSYIYNEKQADTASDFKDAEYIIEGERVQLEGGVADTEVAPGATATSVTRYFGNELMVDLNDDGRDDAVFVLTQQAGASGVFFYVVAALNTEEGYVGSYGHFLGDRIAPQTTELSTDPSHENVIVVNYMDRAEGEPMVAEPSVGKSVWLKFDPESLQFGEVEQDFEGEANPSQMDLTMKTWDWVRTDYTGGESVEPENDAFTLTFNEDDTFGATTDCNGIGGSYSATESALQFSEMISTLMFCEGSQEAEFREMLENTTAYSFTAKGELVLDGATSSAYFR